MNIIPFSKTYIEENNKVKLKDSEKKSLHEKDWLYTLIWNDEIKRNPIVIRENLNPWLLIIKVIRKRKIPTKSEWNFR